MINHLRTMPLVALCALASPIACTAAASYRAVAYMTTQNSEPLGLLEGSPGLFFVQAGAGIIFSVTTQGAVTVLAEFPVGYQVESVPGATGANGLFYSSVEQPDDGAGTGNIISVSSAPGSERTYGTESLAMTPIAGNLPTGKLYGLVYNFSAGANAVGTSDLRGTVATFYQFPGTERPSTPIYGADGNYYGTSYPYGAKSYYFYKLTPSGSLTKIAEAPFNVMLQGTDGNFYGAEGPGACGSGIPGAAYKITPSGQATVLHQFQGCSDGIVDSLIEGSDGKLYGVTEGNSAIFSLTTSGQYKLLFETTNGLSQGLCKCILTQGSDGIIYGTALGGGPSGLGVVFALDAGLPAPQPRSQQFEPASGAVGTDVRLWGYNLLNASVQFNGVPATNVHSSGPNYVWATVPAGATTGPITITTPGGTITTKAGFTVE